MYLEVEENPNCEGTPLQVFEALSPPRRLQKMKLQGFGFRRGGFYFSLWGELGDPV